MTDHNLIIQLRRKSVVAFAEMALPQLIPGFVYYPYFGLIAAKFEQMFEPPAPGRLVANLPPRHGKSALTIAIAAWYLGRYPGREVMLVAHSQSLSDYLASDIKDLMETPFFKATFPEFHFMAGREKKRDFRTYRGGGLFAGSFDTSITGRGADLLLIDDSLSAQDAGSAAERDRVRNSFDSMLITRLNDLRVGSVVLMSHRLHQDDLPGHLVKLGYEHLCLSFMAEEDEEYECNGVGYKRKAGEVLQPGRIDLDSVRALRLPEHVYATQYQQKPTAMGSGVLSPRHFPFVDSCPPGGRTIVSWDIASSTGERASSSVGLVFQVHEKVAYLKHILRGRMDYAELKRRALNLHDTYKPDIHLVEAASLGVSLASELRAHGANVVDIRPGPASKEERVNAVLYKIEANGVRPVAGIPFVSEFIDECAAFPHGSNDDMVDAMSQLLNWLHVEGSTPELSLISRGFKTGRRDKLAPFRDRRW